MKIKTVTPIKHDGEMIPQDTLLDLPAEQAQPLIDAGAALAVDLNGVKTPPKSSKKAG